MYNSKKVEKKKNNNNKSQKDNAQIFKVHKS